MEKPKNSNEEKDSDDSLSDKDDDKNKKNNEEEDVEEDEGGDDGDANDSDVGSDEEKKESTEKKEVDKAHDAKQKEDNNLQQQQEKQEPEKKQSAEQEHQQIQEQKEEIKEEDQKQIKSMNKSNTFQPKFSQQIFNFLRKKSDVDSAKKRFSSQNIQNAAVNSSNSNPSEIWEYQRQIAIEKHQQLCDNVYNKIINRSDVIIDIFSVSIQIFNQYHQQLLKFINMQVPKTQQEIQNLQNKEQQPPQQQTAMQQIFSDFSKLHDKNYEHFHLLLNYIKTQILSQNLEPNLKNFQENIKKIVKQYQTQQKAIQALNEEISKKAFLNFNKLLQAPLQSADKSATKKQVKDLYYLQQKYLSKVAEQHSKQKALGITVAEFWKFQKELEVSLLDYVKKAFTGYALSYQQVFSNDQEGVQQISSIFQNFNVEKNLQEKHSLVLFQDVISVSSEPGAGQNDDNKFEVALQQYFQNFNLKVLQDTEETKFFKEIFEIDAEYKSGKNNVQNKYVMIITNSNNLVVGEKIEKVLFTNHIVNPLYQINLFTQKTMYLPKDFILEIFDIKTKLFSSIKKLSIKFQNEQDFQRFQNSINTEK